MSMMVSFVLSFFPRDVLDEILKLIESVSEDSPSYSSKKDISNTLADAFSKNSSSENYTQKFKNIKQQNEI